MEKRKLLFLFIASLLFILLLGHKAKAQTVKYTSGSLEVDVFVSNPCDGQDNGYIEFNLVAAEGGSATIDLIFGPVSQTNDVIINVGSSYVYNTARTLPSGSYDFYISEDGGNGDVITTFSASVNPIVLTDLQQLVINPDVVSDNTSCASPDGQITISLTGGSQDLPNGGSYDYTITADNGLAEFPVSNSYNGTSTIDFAAQAGLSGLPGGTYTITIDDKYSQCSITESFTIIDPSPEKYNLTSPSSAVCPGESILLSIDGSESGVTYTVNVNGNPTGVNEVGDGTIPTEITVPATEFVDGDVLTVVATNELCTPTEMNGSVVAEVSDLITATATITNVSCFGGNDGSIVVNASGGTGSYTYSIDGGNTFQASNSFSNLSAGNYTIIIKDDAGCEGSETFEVNQPAEIIINTSSTQTTCVGSSDGSITATASGGTGTLTYELNPGAITNTTGEFTGLNAGDYTVSVTDEDNCAVTSGTINVASPADIIIDSESSTDITCFGLTDGTVTVAASGGTGDLTYTISPGGTSNTTGEFTGLGAGDYTVTVTDENKCGPATTGAITVAEPTTITIDETTSEAATCNGSSDGSIIVSASGGTGELTYTITPGGISNTTGEFTGLTAGSYTVSVTDENNCDPVITESIEVTQPNAVTIDEINSEAASCQGEIDGRITVIASGGTGVLTYTISPGGTSTTTGEFTGLSAGDYTVSVTDENNCGPETTGIITVTEPTAISIDESTSVAVSCNGENNGSITVTASGGTGALTFTISPGGASNTTGEFTGLSAGDYTVSITDENNCGPETTGTITITEPTAITIDNTNNVNASCNGSADGSITVAASGGTGTLTYAISPGGTSNTTGEFTGLGAGDYTVSVTDENNCGPVSTGSITVGEPTAITIDDTNSVAVSCNGSADGSITVAASGGTGTLTYTISPGGTSNTTGEFTGLEAGDYTVSVTDEIDCGPVTSERITVASPGPVTIENISSTDITCFGSTDGTITVETSGGTGDLIYTLNPGGTTNNTGTFTGLSAGDYTVSVDDQNNCGPVISESIRINESDKLFIESSGDFVLDCPQDIVSGYFTASGGTSLSSTANKYNFAINENSTGGIIDVSNSRVSLSSAGAGIVTVTVIDKNGCKATSTLTISEPANPLTLDNTGDITLACSADTNGSGTFTASGGDVPYTFDIIENTAGAIISVNNTSVDFSDAGAGEITISVTDANCTTTSTVMVNQPNKLSTSVTNTSDCGVSDGSIDLTVTGGVGPFTYNWSNGADTEDINNLNAGSYTVEVTDEGAGCTETLSVTVSDPSYCEAADCSELDFSPQQLCIDNVLALRLNDVTGVRSKPLNVEIFRAGSLNPTHTEPFEGIPAGNYLVVEEMQALLGPGDYQVRIVQEQDACGSGEKISSASKRFTIAVEIQAEVANTTISLPYPENPNGSITLNNFTGGYPDYMVAATLISPKNPIQSFFSDFDTVRFNKNLQYEYLLKGLPAGIYEIEVIDSLGCSIELDAEVEINTNLFIPNVFTPNGDGKNDTFFIRNLPDSDAKLIIANRWGKEVYRSDNYQNDWDGRNSLEGVYYYQLNVNGEAYNGWLQIITGRVE